MSDKCNTLFVFEGKETERKLVSKLERHVLGSTDAIKCVYGTDIYNLFNYLKDEDFAVDIVTVLKQRSEANKIKLDGYDADSFAYVYFFFDYDAHATMANDAQIVEMLDFFDNETENGKLYVSYPMVEAVKHYRNKEHFRDLSVKCKGRNCPRIGSCEYAEDCLRTPHYKQLATEDCDREKAKLDNACKWSEVIDANLCKANNLVNGNYSLPERLISQSEIFGGQMSKYICQDCPKIAVLSAIPLFVLDYYGVEKTIEILRT